MKTAIVLGGTVPHIGLIQELKSRGYFVVLADYLPNPPAKRYADEHVSVSTLDVERIVELAESKNAELVISTCIDQANSVCCKAAEILGLPSPYSYETSLDVTDKSRMKRIFIENGIPTSKYVSANSVDCIDWSRIEYPSVVKPVDCNSSKGVKKVDSEEEAKAAFIEALSFSRTKTALVEGYVDGIEIQVDCYASADDAVIVMTRQKKQLDRSISAELNSEGSVIPAPILDGDNDQVKEIARKIAKAFGLKNTPFFFQAIVDKTGRVNVLEFAPRIGGGLSFYLLQQIVGYDSIAVAVDSFLGNVPVIELKQPAHFYGTNLIYMQEGVFGSISGIDSSLADGLIKDYFLYKERGEHVGAELRSGNRVGAFIVEADSLDELADKEARVWQRIKVLDPNGNEIMRREVSDSML